MESVFASFEIGREWDLANLIWSQSGSVRIPFFVNGEWRNDPNCSSIVENPFGTSNSLKIVE